MRISKRSAPLTLRVDRSTRLRLDRLAKATARSRAYLAAEAIERYLEQNEWQTQAIVAGVEAADAGELVAHDKVTDWLQSWGKKAEKRPPR